MAQVTPEVAEKLGVIIQPSANTYVCLSELVYALPLPRDDYLIKTGAGLKTAEEMKRVPHAEHPNRYGYARDFLEELATTQMTTPHELIFEKRAPQYESIWEEHPQQQRESN